MRLVYGLFWVVLIAGVAGVLFVSVRALMARATRKARLAAAQDQLLLEAAAKQQGWTLDDIERHRTRLNLDLDRLHKDQDATSQ